MKCKTFKKQVSLYLDDQLNSWEQPAFILHLNQCVDCREYLEQMRTLWQSLRRWPRPQAPADFVAHTMAAFDARSQRRQAGLWGRLVQMSNWATLHPRPVSAVASFVITLVLYSVILGHLKPITYVPVAAHREPITLSSSEFNWLNNAAGPPSSSPYTFPRVETMHQLVASIDQTRKGHFVVVTLIHPDGKASLVEVIDPPGSPEVIEQVQVALRNLSFRPAMISGRPVATQLVLMVQRVDVNW
jgi:hypothetical protein